MKNTARPEHENDDPESGTVRAAKPFRRDLGASRDVFEKSTVPPALYGGVPSFPPASLDPLSMPAANLRAPRVPTFTGLDSLSPPKPAKTPLDQLGGPDAVPRIAISGTALRALTLDHREGFLLSCVDGYSSIEEILDIAGVERNEALQILVALQDKGAIKV